MKYIFLILLMTCFTFCANAQCVDTSYVYLYNPDSNIRILERRGILTYNNQGKLVENISQNFVNNLWVNNYKLNNTYLPNNKLQETILFSWQNNSWINEIIEQYSYDIYGNNTEFINRIWINASWVNNSRTNYFYNNNNKLTQSIYYSNWENNAWVNRIKNDYTLNPAGFSIKINSSKWDNNTNNWKYSSKDSIIRNAVNLVTNIFTFNLVDSKWNLYDNTTYTYNAQGKLTQVLRLIRNNNVWLNNTRNIYQYNANGFEIEYYNEKYNKTLDLWVPSNKTQTEYDAFNKKIAEEYFTGWNDVGEYYNNRERTEYKYCANATVITPSIVPIPKLYPNPLNGDILTLEVVQKSNFVIINMCGKAMLYGALDIGKTSINTQDFPSGIYLIKIGDCIQKLIKP